MAAAMELSDFSNMVPTVESNSVHILPNLDEFFEDVDKVGVDIVLLSSVVFFLEVYLSLSLSYFYTFFYYVFFSLL